MLPPMFMMVVLIVGIVLLVLGGVSRRAEPGPSRKPAGLREARPLGQIKSSGGSS